MDTLFGEESTYVSITIDPNLLYEGNENRITQKVFYNGKINGISYLSKDYWRNAMVPIWSKISVGIATISNIETYLIGDVYSVRVYNRALSDEETLKNYNATLSYYEITQ